MKSMTLAGNAAIKSIIGATRCRIGFGIALVALLHAPSATLALGNLEPPGPPGPSGRTLDQIEPPIPINEQNTPGDADSHFVISRPSVYVLTINLDVTKANGICVTAPNVAIVMQGFAITRMRSGSSCPIRARPRHGSSPLPNHRRSDSSKWKR